MYFPLIAGAVTAVPALVSQAVTTTTPVSGTGVDMSPYEGTLLVILNSAAASTADTLTTVVEESDTVGGTYAAVPAAALFNLATGAAATFATVTDAATSFQVLGLKKDALKRFVRVTVTAAGASISIVCSGSFVVSRKYI